MREGRDRAASPFPNGNGRRSRSPGRPAATGAAVTGRAHRPDRREPGSLPVQPPPRKAAELRATESAPSRRTMVTTATGTGQCRRSV